MNIITISREFGSGGRELGERLARALGYDYYDREIITELAKRKQLDEDYVKKIEDSSFLSSIPVSRARSFQTPSAMKEPRISLLLEQKKVLEEIAAKGRDCVIVGRNADVILKEHNPLALFVFADLDARIGRTLAREEDLKHLNMRQLRYNIRQIDKNRSKTRELIGAGPWKDRNTFDLLINTTGKDLDVLSRGLARWIQTMQEENDGHSAF